MEKVCKFLKENIDDDVVVVGVSGGVDSMVLLSILKIKTPYKIVVAHVHHNLRKESDEELEFVRDYCKNNNLTFEFTKLEYEGKFSEEIARTKRYSFFERVLNKYCSHTLLTAHHGDDLIETIMMKIVRGSTIKGYCGIEKISNRGSYSILRPLLFLTKEDIYEYAKTYNIPYREDYTNSLDEYTRNRYRKYILPFLKQERKDVHLKFLDFSAELSSYYKYVDAIVSKKYKEIVIDNCVNILKFNSLDDFIRKELLMKYLFNIYKKNIVKLTNEHLNIILNFVKDGLTNSSIDMPDGFSLIKEYDTFCLKKIKQVEEYCYEFKNEVELPNGKRITICEESSDNSNFTTRIDLSEVELPLYIRNCLPNDRMSIKNMQGTKKINNIFTNEKINTEERKAWPVVVDSAGKIIWLPGLKKSYFDRKKNEKYDIILKYN